LEQRAVRLAVRQPVTFDAVLSLGGTIESISVEGATSRLNTQDATLGNGFTSEQIVQLPLEARNVTDLLSLQPGVVYLGQNSPTRTVNFGENDPDSRNGAVNGARSDQSNVTLDGVDVNDPLTGFAFNSGVRVLTEAVEEFRVVTAVPGADLGRSSGAQITLVSKGGTNEFHGSLFESHRNTVTSANDFFNNASGTPRPKLLRNVFGGAAGGPAIKNRTFWFGSYEGRRDASEGTVLRTVPLESYRNGSIGYRNRDNAITYLPPSRLRELDPAGRGVNEAALNAIRQFPLPNDLRSAGDGINFGGFRFNSPVKSWLNTYTARVDHQMSSRHQLFVRGNLQHDRSEEAQYLPGQTGVARLNRSRGVAVGVNSTLSPGVLNAFRYGATRIDLDTQGTLVGNRQSFATLGGLTGAVRGRSRADVTHNFVDDLTRQAGRHTVAAGVNIRLIRARRATDVSYASLVPNAVYLRGAGASIVPADMNSNFQAAYISAALNVMGVLSQAQSVYGYDRNGHYPPIGQSTIRRYNTDEYEGYLQDSWRIRPNLTVNVGLRYSIAAPIRERDGNQVAPTVVLSDYFEQRTQAAAAGRPQSALAPFQFDLAGPANGRDSIYRVDRNNFAPRFSVAWSPGSSRKSSLRGGLSILHDRAGSTASVLYGTYDFGFTTSLIHGTGSLDLDTIPRFTGTDKLPAGLLLPPPKFGFPFQPTGNGQPGGLAIGFAPDAKLTTPYIYAFDASWQHELRRNLTIEAAYVGRVSRNLLALFDVTMPVNLADPASQSTYFQAAQQLVRNGNAPAQGVGNIAYWENVFPALGQTVAQMTSRYGANFTRVNPGLAPETRLSATQVAHYLYNQVPGVRYTTVLSNLDTQCVPACSKFGRFAFFNDQFNSLSGWRSVAPASYHALQVIVRKRFASGTHFDFNYTLSRAYDWSSGTERSDVFQDSAVINSYAPDQMWGPSSFDLRHQGNANWIAELPFGRGKRFGAHLPGYANAVLGGWQIAGIGRWTSGFATNVVADTARATNPYVRGFRTPIGETPETQNVKNASGIGGPNLFADPVAAFAQFGMTLPGETGPRNNLRGQGLFGIDFGVSKKIVMPWSEGHHIAFRWEVFNATNSVRFDAGGALNGRPISLTDQSPATFGRYTATLVPPRVIQFLLRYQF